MTTQTVTVTLMGKKKARIFEVTATDAQWNEVTSKTGTKSLGDIMKGVRIETFRAEFAAAVGVWRIVDTNQDDKIKAMGLMDQLGENRTRDVETPPVIGEDDILQVYCDVA